jgi:hypothetical protein
MRRKREDRSKSRTIKNCSPNPLLSFATLHATSCQVTPSMAKLVFIGLATILGLRLGGLFPLGGELLPAAEKVFPAATLRHKC